MKELKMHRKSRVNPTVKATKENVLYFVDQELINFARSYDSSEYLADNHQRVDLQGFCILPSKNPENKEGGKKQK